MGTSRNNRGAHKNKSRFFESQPLPVNASVKFSHPISLGGKVLPEELKNIPFENLPQKYKNAWIIKQVANSQEAYHDVISQELLRFYIPGQPKTRLLIDDNGNHYVASKKIEGARILPMDELRGTGQQQYNDAIRKGIIHGLGEVALFSLFLNEVDLKNGNLIFDKNYRIIKLDGDWCFAPLRGRPGNSITKEQIGNLPGPPPHACNWLGYKGEEVLYTSPLLAADISNNTHVRREINEALLKILSTPDYLFEKFAKIYTGDMGLWGNPFANVIATQLKEKRQELWNAALDNAHFQEYILSSAAENQLNEFIAHIKSFNTMQKNRFIGEEDIAAIREEFTSVAAHTQFYLETTEELQVEQEKLAKLEQEKREKFKEEKKAEFSTSMPTIFTAETSFLLHELADKLKTISPETSQQNTTTSVINSGNINSSVNPKLRK